MEWPALYDDRHALPTQIAPVILQTPRLRFNEFAVLYVSHLPYEWYEHPSRAINTGVAGGGVGVWFGVFVSVFVGVGARFMAAS